MSRRIRIEPKRPAPRGVMAAAVRTFLRIAAWALVAIVAVAVAPRFMA